MKILYFLPKLQNCGPANVVLNNIRELKKSNPDINIGMISYRNNEKTNNFKISCQKLGVNEFYSLQSKTNFFQKYLYLREITKTSDIIHSNGFFPDLYTSILFNHVVKVSTAHSIISKDYRATYGIFKGSIYAVLHHLVYLNPSFNHIAACSEQVEKHVKTYSIFNRKRITTIHNGIDKQHFNRLDSNEKANLKAKIFKSLSINLVKDTEVLVYSGRLTRLKRVPELIEWFLKSSNNNSILIVLGDGDEMQQCIKAAKKSENIFFLGFVDETTPYYEIADYIVSNSSLEGFPLGVLEGMSCGCKAILSDIPAHREVVKYFPSMAMLFSDYHSKTVNFNHNFSEQELDYLSSKRMSNEYLNIYQKYFKRKS